MFSTAACTWAKTLLRLQVWNLFTNSEQIMRAADCKSWRKRPQAFFDKLKSGQLIAARFEGLLHVLLVSLDHLLAHVTRTTSEFFKIPHSSFTGENLNIQS